MKNHSARHAEKAPIPWSWDLKQAATAWHATQANTLQALEWPQINALTARRGLSAG